MKARAGRNHEHSSHSHSTVTISQSREHLLTLPFRTSSRASLPRPMGVPDAVVPNLAGVPKKLRSRIGKNLVPLSFPYPRQIHCDGDFEWREYDIIKLENARWRIRMCPNLGGRILSIFDKSIHRELLWQTACLNNSVIGLAGAWSVGGIEFNAFRYGHHVHGLSKVEVRDVVLQNKMHAIQFGSTDELFGCSWQVTLTPLSECVAYHIKIQNHTDIPQPAYWWTNIAVPMDPHTRIMMSPGHCLHHGMFRSGFQHEMWPNLHHSDWSDWTNHHEVISAYLYEHKSDYTGYAHPREGWAMAHRANRKICKGRKIWSLGSQHDHHVFWDRIGEHAFSSYAEMQSGLSPTQVEATLIGPREIIEFTETITTFPWHYSGDYKTAFDSFSKKSAHIWKRNGKITEQPHFWSSKTKTILTTADPRLKISEQIVKNQADQIPVKEIQKLVRENWVGGSQWIKLLEKLNKSKKLDEYGTLALAAAQLDAGHLDEARRLLSWLIPLGEQVSAYAAYLLGRHAEHLNDFVKAEELYESAIGIHADEVDFWEALGRVLLAQLKIQKLEETWNKAPPQFLLTDEARMSRAHAAFHLQHWSEARNLLLDPLLSIPEGRTSAWLLMKEIYLAEAIKAMESKLFAEAHKYLFYGCKAMPQFGIGRNERDLNVDLLYYRWLLAQYTDDEVTASSLVSHILRKSYYPGSVEAGYAALLAKQIKDPSAETRIQQIRAWRQDSTPAGLKNLLLENALADELFHHGKGGWFSIQSDPLYLYRAKFELGLGKQMKQTLVHKTELSAKKHSHHHETSTFQEANPT
jgi:tetratricopeptide (TPR) repeat protein